jgi:hypothetical protein
MPAPKIGGSLLLITYLDRADPPAAVPNSMLDSVPGKLDVRLVFVRYFQRNGGSSVRLTATEKVTLLR